MNEKILAVVAACAIALVSSDAIAKGGGRSSSGGKSTSSHSSPSSAGPGTGAKSQSTQVRSYTKKDGTHVSAAKRSTPDKNFRNNWSTKGNTNPSTGKKGSQVEPPKKH
jgi:hypothetical protein